MWWEGGRKKGKNHLRTGCLLNRIVKSQSRSRENRGGRRETATCGAEEKLSFFDKEAWGLERRSVEKKGTGLIAESDTRKGLETNHNFILLQR